MNQKTTHKEKRRYPPNLTLLRVALVGLIYSMGLSRSADVTSLASECFEIGFMPHEVFVTHAKDHDGDLVDINNFNKFHTFQVEREKNGDDSSIQTTFRAKKSSGEGFLFRLRAELSSAFSDDVQQGMRVSLIDLKDKSILVDATSIDDNAGTISIDYEHLKEGANYSIKYEFFDKQLVSTKDMGEFQLSGSQTECKLPFVTQQLLIQDRRLVKTRVQSYNDQEDKLATSLKNFKCNLGKFSNQEDSPYGEDGLFCKRETYTYLADSSTSEINKVFEIPFDIRGIKNELITYWYEMLIGYNMMVGNGLQVMLSRDDIDVEDEESQFRCLYDKTCVLAKMSNKNELKVDLILTSGEYKLTFFDVQSNGVRNFFKNEAGLTKIPITFKLSSYPVLQNEERVNCPYMFMDKHFIQNKFIDNMHGQRFSYSDKIIMNIFNLSQMIDITPVVDSIIKIKVKEAFGVNTMIVMCTDQDCLMNSVHIGTSQILFAQVKKGVTYSIELGYSNSIITMSSFFTCPHINLEISMAPLEKALETVKLQQCTRTQDLDTEEKLNTIFNSFTSNKNTSYIFEDHTTIFTVNVDQSAKTEKNNNYEVVSKKFIVTQKKQLFLEIFYETYFYDLELYLVSEDATIVRSHIYKETQKVDWSLYKGAKQIYVELEPGTYDLKIVQKLPGITSDLTQFQAQCVSFQLRVILDEFVQKSQMIPNDFNYFGLLGPTGKDFGQMIYYCSECTIADLPYKAIQFRLEDKGEVNIDVIIQSESSSVGVKLQDIKLNDTAKMVKSDIDQQVQSGRTTGIKNAKKGTVQGNEESLSKEKLKTQTNYILVIVGKADPTKQEQVTFNLKVEITEKKYRADSKDFKEVLPKNPHEVLRYKLKTEGMKESEFLIGNRFMLEYIDKNDLQPFIPKSEIVYQAKYKDSKGEIFQHAIPFEIKEEEGEIFAAIYDYSGIANLGMSIIKQTDSEDFEVTSIPGKYYSYIQPVTLTRGLYQLVIEPQTYFAYEDEVILRFGLDLLYEKENITQNDYELVFDSMELCGLPSFPDSLNSPQFLHPLTGNSLQIIDYYKIDEAVNGERMTFEIFENSLVTFYMEIPKDITAFAELSKAKGTHKTRASTKDLNFKNDNFLRQKDLSGQNVVEFREFLNPGLYNIRTHAFELEQELTYSMPRCQAFKVGMTITPLKDNKVPESELCTAPISLGEKLKFDQIVEGDLKYEIHTPIFDTAYIQTDSQGEGPFFFYFELSYDIQQEGAIAVVLSKYDSDSLSFAEHTLYEVQDGQSLLTAIIEEGTYVVSIQSLTSTDDKFLHSGLGKTQQISSIKLYERPCIRMHYNYFVTTMNKNDVKVLKLGFMDFLSSLFSGDSSMFKTDEAQLNFDKSLTNDIREIGNSHCQFDLMPRSFPNQPEGFDKTFTLRVSKKNYEIIDFVNDENSLLKIFVKTRNTKNNVNIFLYKDAQLNDALAFSPSKSGSKDFIAYLKPQKKAYKLKIVYDSLDESDECPLFDFRISVKPLSNLLEENLRCKGLSNAPEVIDITQSDFDLDQEFAISNGLIDKFDDKKDISYDIEINLPSSKYYFDVELRYDFLTTGIDFGLYGIDNKNFKLILGRSEWVNEQNLGDSGAVDLASSSSSKDFIQRLRLLNTEVLLSEDQTLQNKYILRLRFTKQMYRLVQILKEQDQLTSEKQACFPFDLSIRATEIKADDQRNKNELIRIDWSLKMLNQLVDPRQKLTAFLQFQYNMEESYKMLKFGQFVYLQPISSATDNKKLSDKIFPQTTRLSTIDKSSIVVTFKHNQLERGTCYILKIDKSQMQEKYDEALFVNQTKICTTNCHCNLKGTKSCDEKLGECQCHYPYISADCSQCGFKHILDPISNECVKIKQCKDKGGEEDCNGHGSCGEDEQSGQAVCQCDLGFINDGLDNCAKCSDPMFTYPHCEIRSWVLEHPDINCRDLPLKMPKFLYKYNNSIGNDTIFQNEEGLLEWGGRYRLVGEKYLKKSTHFFMVPRNSVMRFFFDTLKSGVMIKYTVLNNKKEVIFTTRDEEQFMEADVLFELLPQTERHNPREHPFALEIEYQYDKSALVPGKCPLIDLNLLVQPFDKIQKHLKCTEEELSNSKQIKQFSWQFGSQKSQVISESFTLTSEMKPGSGGYITDKNENFDVMKYQIKIEESGNALSVIASYTFESVVLAMSLVDVKTKNILAIEDIETLEDIQSGLEDASMDEDMVSFIEMPKIPAGDYELQILVMRSLFLPTKEFPTCISFDLSIEYIVRSISKQQALSVNSGSPTYEVLSVYPARLKKLTTQKKGKIDVQFNQDITLDELVKSENDLHQVCHLINQQEKSNTINPYKVMITKHDTLDLFFNFKSVKVPQDSLCYSMVCTTQGTVGKEQIKAINFETRYCFEKESVLSDQVSCNPWAFAKVAENKCLCTYPYTGPLCEECRDGYIAEESNVSKGKHTVCALDQSKCSEAVCNNHGACIKNPAYAKPEDDICSCEDLFTGQFCEKCQNTTLAYPDCKKIRSDIYDESTDKEYLLRRKYNKDGYERYRLGDDHHNKLNSQCSWTSYPQDLNKLEINGFLGGPFHLAEFYTINHDADNLIYYTPKKEGILKLFIQQPEAQELRVNDEIFDIEIGVYDVEKEKFLATSMNHHLKLGQAGISGKLEYAALSLQIPFDVVNHPLIIMFRALNFSGSTDQKCELVYFELEFVEKARECKNNKELEQSNEIIRVSEMSPYRSIDVKVTHSLNHNKKTFFNYQDLYFDGKTDTDEDFEVKISVQQKFSEANFIDFLVEVLESDIEYYDIEKEKYRSSQKPECDNICLISGQKAYNEFHNVIQMSSRTYFRIWFFQSEHEGACANFQVFIEANKLKPEISAEKLSNLKCEELDLPHTLNIDRYLGGEFHTGKQNNFHYLEYFRVDNIKNSSTHRIDFTLTQPAVVRFTTPVHKHIELDLELRQIFTEHGYKKNKKLVVSAARGFEDSIFSQLDVGDYQIRLLFAAEEFFMGLPCQSIQLELAITPISDARQFIQQAPKIEPLDFSLGGILQSANKQQEVQQVGLIKTYSLTDPNVSKEFVSYIELYNKIFTLPDKLHSGLMIFVQSDYLLNDINFAITHLATQQVYHNVKRENLNKLVIDNLPEGEFELIIYAHHCLTNMKKGDYLESLDVKFIVDFNIVRWSSEDDFMKHFVSLKIGENNFKVEIDTIDINEFSCYYEYSLMPEDLQHFGHNEIDMSQQYMIPQVDQVYTHTMSYIPQADQDSLRIIVDRSNTKISIYKKQYGNRQKDREIITQSYSTLRGQAQVLIAIDLQQGTEYEIQYDFDVAENEGEFEGKQCQSFKLQIWSTHYSNMCQNQVQNERKSDLSLITAKKEPMTHNRAITMIQSSIVLDINVVDDFIDIEISYDYANVLFMPALKLTKSMTNKVDLTQEDIRQAASQETRPTEIYSALKNLVTYKFNKVPKGDYHFLIFQSKKPTDCTNYLNLVVKTYKPQDQTANLEKEQFGMLKQYQSALEIMDLNRYVENLPISFDTYKYLKEEQFMLVSEYIQISDKQKNNKISFKIHKNNTLFRLYVENDELVLSLKEITSSKTQYDYKTTSMLGKLNKGDYELSFDFHTEFSRKKAFALKNKVHITIMIAEEEYYQTMYVQRHGNNLKNCEKNTNFPLSLNKRGDETQSDKEAVYDYPVLRLSPEVMKSKYLIDTYSFRVNDTSRFYINMGMHMIAHQVTLQISDLKYFGIQYVGKQEYNLNILDITLSPGDYALTIQQTSLFDRPAVEETCGLFSFFSKITPINEMSSSNGEITQSKCEIKEVLPNKIYASEDATKNGLEYFVNSQGTFFRAFQAILYKKSRYSQFNPEFDKIAFNLKEDALVSILIQYRQKGNQPIVKLYDAYAYVEADNTLTSVEQEAANSIIENSITFKVSANKEYTLFIYYEGEVTFDQDNQQQCEYYNVFLAINHVSFLRKDFQCIDNKDSKANDFISSMPKTIGDKDFSGSNKYKYKEFLELRYPTDFEKLSHKEEQNILIKTIDINLSDKFNLDITISYDYPFSLFGLGLLEKQVQADGKSYQLEDVSSQLAVFPQHGLVYEETLERQIRTHGLDANKKYLLAFSDEQSRLVFEYISNSSAKTENANQNLCLYVEVDILLTKQKAIEALISGPPTILSISHGGQTLAVDRSQKEVVVSVEFSTPPAVRYIDKEKQQMMTTHNDAIAQVVTLQWVTPNLDYRVEYARKPIRITKDGDGRVWSFAFDIVNEQQKKDFKLVGRLHLDLESLIDTKGTLFTLGQEVKMPHFYLPEKQSFEQKKQDNENHISKIEKEKNKASEGKMYRHQVNLDDKDVKCLCVHGKCDKGKATCNRCDQGWEGILCDIKSVPTNINKDVGERKSTTKMSLDSSTSDRKQSKDESKRYATEERNSEAGNDVSVTSEAAKRHHTEKPEYDYNFDHYENYFDDHPKATPKVADSSYQTSQSQQYENETTSLMDQLYDYSVLLFVIAVIGICGYLAVNKSQKMRDYMPINLNEYENESENESAMELSDLRSKDQKAAADKKDDKKKQSQQRSKQQLNEDQKSAKNKKAQTILKEQIEKEEEKEHAKLVDDLLIFAHSSEQDHAQMEEDNHSPESLRKQLYDEEQPQHVNEQETANEINDALNDMEDDDEGFNDEDAELKRFF